MSTGGSSSGIGTAANLWAANVGTETSGSILSPSNQNMLAGIKPTVGLDQPLRHHSDHRRSGHGWSDGANGDRRGDRARRDGRRRRSERRRGHQPLRACRSATTTPATCGSPAFAARASVFRARTSTATVDASGHWRDSWRHHAAAAGDHGGCDQHPAQRGRDRSSIRRRFRASSIRTPANNYLTFGGCAWLWPTAKAWIRTARSC